MTKLNQRIAKVNQELFKNAYVKRNNKWLPSDKRPKSISTARQYEFFRKEFGTEFGIDTKIVEMNDDFVCMKSEIVDNNNGRIIAVGFSTQYWGEGNEIPKAETYSKSRALCNFGLIDGDITSYEENVDVGNQMEEVNKDIPQNNGDIEPDFVIKKYKTAPNLKELERLTKEYESFETKLLKTNHLISTWRLVVNARENRLSSLKNNKRSNNER